MLFSRKNHMIIFLNICSGIILLSAALIGCTTPSTSTVKHLKPASTSISSSRTPSVTSKPVRHTTGDQVIQYDRLPDALSSPTHMTVDGQSVFVERYKDISYGRFAFTGTAHIVVTDDNAANYTISPKKFHIQAQRQGNTLAFALTTPHNLILQSGANKLFVFADAPEQNAPTPDSANVLNVTKYMADTNGTTTQTAYIQRAIDEASATHSTVYFPRGKYISGMLKMRSDANIYLASGALLEGTGNALDTPGNFIQFNNVHNVRLYGHGAIDLHGMALRNSAESAGRVKIIRTISSTNIDIQDVMLRDAGSWTVHILGSDAVHINNIKILNDSSNTNNDGIDPDGSSNVTVNGAFIYTTDDCFAVKTSGALHILQPTQNVMIENSICYTKKSALKVGTETRAALSNITFAQNDVVHADRAIALYMADGSILNNVNYLNNTSEFIGGDSKQRLIDIAISDRTGIGSINNVNITNYTAYQFSPGSSVIAGMGGNVVGVTFKNLNVAGTPINNVSAAMIIARDANINFAP
jgi:polygalacturonase